MILVLLVGNPSDAHTMNLGIPDAISMKSANSDGVLPTRSEAKSSESKSGHPRCNDNSRPSVVLPDPEMPANQIPIHPFISLMWLDISLLSGHASYPDDRLRSLTFGCHVAFVGHPRHLVIPALLLPIPNRSDIIEKLVGFDRNLVAQVGLMVHEAMTISGPLSYLYSETKPPSLDTQLVREHVRRFHGIEDHLARWLV